MAAEMEAMKAEMAAAEAASKSKVEAQMGELQRQAEADKAKLLIHGPPPVYPIRGWVNETECTGHSPVRCDPMNPRPPVTRATFSAG